MLTKVKPQVYPAVAPKGRCGTRPVWLMDDPADVSPRKQVGFAVTSLAGMKRIREAYQTATGTWVGAD